MPIEGDSGLTIDATAAGRGGKGKAYSRRNAHSVPKGGVGSADLAAGVFADDGHAQMVLLQAQAVASDKFVRAGGALSLRDEIACIKHAIPRQARAHAPQCAC